MEIISKYQIRAKKKVPNIFESYFEKRGDDERFLISLQRCAYLLPGKEGKVSRT